MLRKMGEDPEIIPVQSLGKLSDIEILDKEYFISQNQYVTNLQILHTNQDQFMRELLQYIEFNLQNYIKLKQMKCMYKQQHIYLHNIIMKLK